LLAIAFAVALWSVVAYAQNPTQSHNYALRMDTPVLPAGLVLVGDVPQVTFTAIGTADHLRAFDAQLRSNPGMLHISGNFSGTHVGKNNVPIHVNNADPTITIDAPSSVTVTLDDLGTTTVPVSIERVKALPPGFHELASATTLTPPSVRIDGPKSQLPDIQAVVLVDLDALVAPGFNQPYSVVVWDKNKKPLTKSMTVTPAQVTVKMVIQADAITVAKSVGFTLTGQPAAGYRVSNVQIAPLEVQVTGLQNTLAGLVLLATDPIDITGARSDVVRTVTIRPPDGVTTNQKTAQVHVFISPIPGVSPSPGP
jgi:YbbR domain-containing protein